MKPFSVEEHRDALIRRRIKFVVEKGAMARLFRKGTSADLQDELLRRIRPERLSLIRTQDDYDKWLERTVELDCWAQYAKDPIEQVRWGHFAKLINIIVYEVVANRELFAEADWQRIRSFLHVPIDSNVSDYLTKFEETFPAVWVLKGMTKKQYMQFQEAARRLGDQYGVPTIWFEASWSD